MPGGGAEPQRHLFALPRGRGPSQTPKFLSPGPPSPWLPALPIEKLFYRFCGKLAIPKAHPFGRVVRLPCSSAARVQARGCKGRSPLHEITLVSPFPSGEGGWGDGGKSKTKGRVGKRQRRQAPPQQIPERQGQPATNRASPHRASGSPLLPAPGRRNETKSGRRHNKQATPE